MTGEGKRDAEIRLVLGMLHVLERQADRLHRSVNDLAARRPFNPTVLTAMDANTETALDAFILRFIQLQDTLGTQIFRGILILDQNPIPVAMIDLAAAMARRGIMDDEADWTRLRLIHNRLTHDYPDQPEHRAAALEDALAASATLLAIAHGAATYIRHHRALP